jgi:hypothetical protein
LASYYLFLARFIALAYDFGSHFEGSSSTFVVAKIVLSIGKQGSELDGSGIGGKCALLDPTRGGGGCTL